VQLTKRDTIKKRTLTGAVLFISVLLTGILILPTSCGLIPRAGVIAAGSTSVQPFAEILAEDFMKTHPGINIDVQGGGSAAGILAAQSATADIGMSSRDLVGNELSLWHVEIAKDGLALIVNPKNTIGALSLDQARDIYAGTITNWKELGGANHKIHVVSREDGSGTRSSFESMVMRKTQIEREAIVQDSNGAVKQVISGDSYAIGYISLGLVDQSVKPITLDGIQPTRTDVVNGTYLLTRPFLFVSKNEPVGEVKQFVDFVLSDEGRKILDNEGLVTTERSITP
jgi:phosphate transport system substrate-binding protein